MDLEQNATPRFRTDLVARPIDEDGERFVDVTDPDSGTTFRFYEVEYSLACAMDGVRDLDSLREWALAELGLETTWDELRAVVGTLADLGYLEPGHGGTAEPSESRAPAALPETPPGTEFPDNWDAAPVRDIELGAPGRVETPPVGFRVATPSPASDFVELAASGGNASPEAAQGADGAAPAAPGADIFATASAIPSARTRDVEFADRGAEAPTAPEVDEASFAGLFDGDDEGAASGEPPRAARSMFAPREGLGGDAEVGGAQAVDDGWDEVAAPPVSESEGGFGGFRRFGDEDRTAPPDFQRDEVSVDLSDHLPIDADSVKEAVRQSKVMKSVEPEEAEPLPPIAARVEEDDNQRLEVVPAFAGEEKFSGLPLFEATAADEPGASPVELPEQPVSVTGPMFAVGAEPEEEMSELAASSRRRILVLVGGVLLAAGGLGGTSYVLYQNYERQGAATEESAALAPGERAPGSAATSPPPAAPPPAPRATLVLDEGRSHDVVMPQTGLVSDLPHDGAQVMEGAIIGKLRSYTRHYEALIHARKRREHYEWSLAEARKALAEAREQQDPARIRRAERTVIARSAKVEEKKGMVEAAKQGLEASVLKAPSDGTVKRLVEEGQVKQGEPVLRIQIPGFLTAAFRLPPGPAKYTVGGQVVIASTEDATRVASCRVDKVLEGGIVVVCPAEGTLGPGDDVFIK